MKVFGIHNTVQKANSYRQMAAKMYLDRVNKAFCINKKLMSLLGIEQSEKTLIVFVEDNNGLVGIAVTEDETVGLPVFWYKSDTRARVFNDTMITYLTHKYKLDTRSSSYHLLFDEVPKKVGRYQVFQIKNVFPFKRSGTIVMEP